MNQRHADNRIILLIKEKEFTTAREVQTTFCISYAHAALLLEKSKNLTEPRPCPFCGKSEVECVYDAMGGWVVCDQCGAQGTAVYADDDMDCDELEIAAFDAWNTRKQP